MTKSAKYCCGEIASISLRYPKTAWDSFRSNAQIFWRALEIALPAQDISLGDAADAQTIQARVQAHEWVGRELQIVAALDGSPIRLRTRQHLDLRIGEEVTVRLNLKRAQAFDPKTGSTLRSSAQQRA